jgi:UDP-2,3-diacylglucosamine pyrophosphatase LpxH
MQHKNFFVSDLHLFSRRSLAEQHLPLLQESIAHAENFVLGGDIFDFRWSTLSKPNATVEAAVRWLEELVTLNRNCQFHFVLGNHDYNRNFIHALDDFAASCENLQWHRYYLRMSNSLFLHGDIADHPQLDSSSLHIRRQKWLHDETRGELAHWLYDLAIHAKLHKIASLVHRHRKVTTRILNYAEQIGHGPATGLEHVYFGHTHCAMSHFPNGGLLFHNGGAPMKGLEFRIVPVDLKNGN